MNRLSVVAAFAIVLSGAMVLAFLKPYCATNARGEPIDFPGVTIWCPVCQDGMSDSIGGYKYKCRQCNKEYCAKTDSNGMSYETSCQ